MLNKTDLTDLKIIRNALSFYISMHKEEYEKEGENKYSNHFLLMERADSVLQKIKDEIEAKEN